jgi:hypothetical protein
MFFKSLSKVKPKNKKEIKMKAKVEAQKKGQRDCKRDCRVKNSDEHLPWADGNTWAVGLTIANAIFARPEVEWRKVAALGLIFIVLEDPASASPTIKPR